MNRRSVGLAFALLCLGVIALVVLSVYPFHYGFWGSAALAAAFVLFGVWEFILDEAFTPGE